MKPAFAFLPLVLLAACHGGPSIEARMKARQQAVDPPRLWLMEDLGAGGMVTAATFVCADTPMRETFARTNAEIEGAPCNDTVAPVVRAGFSAHRCEADGRRYAITSEATGDLARDFRVAVMITPLSADLGSGRITRHYRRLGACPADWQVGDQHAR